MHEFLIAFFSLSVSLPPSACLKFTIYSQLLNWIFSFSYFKHRFCRFEFLFRVSAVFLLCVSSTSFRLSIHKRVTRYQNTFQRSSPEGSLSVATVVKSMYTDRRRCNLTLYFLKIHVSRLCKRKRKKMLEKKDFVPRSAHTGADGQYFNKLWCDNCLSKIIREMFHSFMEDKCAEVFHSILFRFRFHPQSHSGTSKRPKVLTNKHISVFDIYSLSELLIETLRCNSDLIRIKDKTRRTWGQSNHTMELSESRISLHKWCWYIKINFELGNNRLISLHFYHWYWSLIPDIATLINSTKKKNFLRMWKTYAHIKKNFYSRSVAKGWKFSYSCVS